MRATNTDKLLKSLYPDCKVKINEARELSWRKFYHDIGGLENAEKLEGTSKFSKFIIKCENVFISILENKVTDEILQGYIALKPTQNWESDQKGKVIKIRKSVNIKNSKGVIGRI